MDKLGLLIWKKKFNTGYKCEWVPNSNSSNTIRANAYKMLPGWGYGRVYTMVVVNCTFSEILNYDNSGEKLTLYVYYSTSPKRYKKIVALEGTDMRQIGHFSSTWMSIYTCPMAVL